MPSGQRLIAFTCRRRERQTYKLSWSTLAGGGGGSTNDFFGVSGTVGQTEAPRDDD